MPREVAPTWRSTVADERASYTVEEAARLGIGRSCAYDAAQHDAGSPVATVEVVA